MLLSIASEGVERPSDARVGEVDRALADARLLLAAAVRGLRSALREMEATAR